ncbi:MAG TPA: WavE lipopolysaccharide synthesis family protein [Rhodocyclaceae bacterium]
MVACAGVPSGLAAAATPVADCDISVVVQGPLLADRTEGIERCLRSIQAVMPQAEIIVSTWLGEPTDRLDSDCHVVTSEDPGCFWETPDRPYNLNRLQVSTLAGLRRASRPYCLKFRADCALADRRFMTIAAPRPRSLFSRPMNVTNLYVRDPERFPFLFYVSDTVQFGTTADLLDFWSGDPFTATEVLRTPRDDAGLFSNIRLFPEQALALRWLTRHQVHLDFPRSTTLNRQLLRAWETALVDNFALHDWRSSGIQFPARFAEDPTTLHTLLTPERVASLPQHAFSYRRALMAKYLEPTYLVHGRLGPLVSALQARHPTLYRNLRKVWISYQKART